MNRDGMTRPSLSQRRAYGAMPCSRAGLYDRSTSGRFVCGCKRSLASVAVLNRQVRTGRLRPVRPGGLRRNARRREGRGTGRPDEKILYRDDALFTGTRYLIEALEAVARLGTRLINQKARRTHQPSLRYERVVGV